MLVKDLSLTVLDFETTGKIGPYPDEPWQIAYVKIEKGKINPESFFSSYLYISDRPFNPYAPGKHDDIRGILGQSVKFRELWPDITENITSSPLVAHNAATERKILTHYFPLHEFGPWIDTLKISRALFPKAQNHKLESIVSYLNLQNKLKDYCPNLDYHDALYDTVATALIIETILNETQWENLTLEQILNPSLKNYYAYRKELKNRI